MIKPYDVTCADPECAEAFTVIADPTQLAEDEGTIAECPECGCDIEYDYDAATDTLTVTPGQEFEDLEDDIDGEQDLANGEFEDEE
jgi:hypothetical protein